MLRIIAITSLIILASCGSSEKAVEKPQKVFKKIDNFPELAGITNDDFRPQPQVKYDATADYHVIGSLVEDALGDESLAKLSDSQVKSVSNAEIKGVDQCYLGNTKQGLTALNKAYDKYKSNPSYWNMIGNCYYNNNSRRLAKVFYNKALSLNSDFLPAINNLGVVYIHEGRVDKAVAAFNHVLKLKPTAKTAKFNLANLFLKHGVLEKADQLLNQILLSNKDQDVLLSLTYVSLFQGKPARALNYLKVVGSDELRNPTFSLALYFTYKKMNNEKYKKIEKYLEEQKLNQEQARTFAAIKKM